MLARQSQSPKAYSMSDLRRMYLHLVLGFGLMSCAPVPMTPERAERLCREEAGLADGVQGNVGVGVGTGGARAKGSIVLTDRVFNPQTEEEFMSECIERRLAGEPRPTRFGISVGGRV